MIYFVRHGSTDWNDYRNSDGIKCPKCQGRVDLPLNEAGLKQAEKTKEFLRNIKFKRIICSPLIRARQTCDIISNGTATVEIDDRLIERDFGEFEGLTRSEFDFNGFWNSNRKQKFEKAESINDVETRVFELLDELKKNPNDNILLVSHGGVGCVLMSYFKGKPKDGNYLTFEIPTGSPLILDFNKKNKFNNEF